MASHCTGTTTTNKRSVLSPHDANERPQTMNNATATQLPNMRCAACQKIRRSSLNEKNDKQNETTTTDDQKNNNNRGEKCLACRSRRSRSIGRALSKISSSNELSKKDSQTSVKQASASLAVMRNENHRDTDADDDPHDAIIIRPSISAGDDHPSISKECENNFHSKNLTHRTVVPDVRRRSLPVDATTTTTTTKSSAAVTFQHSGKLPLSLAVTDPAQKRRFSNPLDRLSSRAVAQKYQQQQESEKPHSQQDPVHVPTFISITKKSISTSIPEFLSPITLHSPSSNHSLDDGHLDSEDHYVNNKDLFNDTTELADAEVRAILDGRAKKFGNSAEEEHFTLEEDVINPVLSSKTQYENKMHDYDHENGSHGSFSDSTDEEIQAILFDKDITRLNQDKGIVNAASTAKIAVPNSLPQIEVNNEIQHPRNSNDFQRGTGEERILSKNIASQDHAFHEGTNDEDNIHATIMASLTKNCGKSGENKSPSDEERTNWTEKSENSVSEKEQAIYHPLDNDECESLAMSSACEHPEKSEIVTFVAGATAQKSETTPLLLWSNSCTESELGLSPRENKPLLLLAEVAAIPEEEGSQLSCRRRSIAQQPSSIVTESAFSLPESHNIKALVPSSRSAEGDGIEVIVFPSVDEQSTPDIFGDTDIQENGETFSTTGATLMANTSLFPSKSSFLDPSHDEPDAQNYSITGKEEMKRKENYSLTIQVDNHNNSMTIEMMLRNDADHIKKSENNDCASFTHEFRPVEILERHPNENSVRDGPFLPFKCCKAMSSDDFPMSPEWSGTWSRKGTREDEVYSFQESFDLFTSENPIRSCSLQMKEANVVHRYQSFTSRMSSDDQLFSSSGSSKNTHEEGFLEQVARFANGNHQLCSQMGAASVHDHDFDFTEDIFADDNVLSSTDVALSSSADSDIEDKHSDFFLQSDEPRFDQGEIRSSPSTSGSAAKMVQPPETHFQSNAIFKGIANHIEEPSVCEFGVEVQFAGTILTDRFDDGASTTSRVEGYELNQSVEYEKNVESDTICSLHENATANFDVSIHNGESYPLPLEDDFEDDETGVLSDEFSFYDNESKTKQQNSLIEDECPMLEAALEEFQSCHERLNWREESGNEGTSMVCESVNDELDSGGDNYRISNIADVDQIVDEKLRKSLGTLSLQHSSLQPTSVSKDKLDERKGTQASGHNISLRSDDGNHYQKGVKSPVPLNLTPEEFDWRKEIQSPAPQNRFLVNEDFDWRKEIQSPALQRRGRRRVRRVRFSTGSNPKKDTETSCIGSDPRRSLSEEYSSSIVSACSNQNPITIGKILRFSERGSLEQLTENSEKSPASSTSTSFDWRAMYSPYTESPAKTSIGQDASYVPICKEQDTPYGSSNVLDEADLKSCSSDSTSQPIHIDLDEQSTAHGILKENGQTILMTVQEDMPESQEGFSMNIYEYKRLAIENKKLRDRLHSLRLDFDKRVSPFRDLFVEQRKLREQIEKLQNERQQIDETLASVQQRTRTAVAMSMQKSKFLQSKLAEVMRENEIIPKLQSQLDEARYEIRMLKYSSEDE
jgi:hypothetical protein